MHNIKQLSKQLLLMFKIKFKKTKSLPFYNDLFQMYVDIDINKFKY